MSAVPFKEMTTERDWVFARRFAVRRMIERGDPSAADHIPDIPEIGAMQDEIERLRRALYWAHVGAPNDPAEVVVLDHATGTARLADDDGTPGGGRP